MKSWKRRSQLLTVIAAGLVHGVALAAPDAGATVGPDRLLQAYQQLLPRLQDNPFGRPLVIASRETGREVQGEVFAVLDFAHSLVGASLDKPAAWCELLMLPINTKGCTVTPDGDLALYLGKKTPQPLADAARIEFEFQHLQRESGGWQVVLTAPQGPWGTSDYRIVLESVALPQGRSFVHLRYAYQVGLTGQLAFATYLNTAGRDKVGFSAGEKGALVGGVRGIVERTTMRYYLALDAYLRSLELPSERQLESRLHAWFSASERYARQLHEIERTDYLQMKRAEIRRQRGQAS